MMGEMDEEDIRRTLRRMRYDAEKDRCYRTHRRLRKAAKEEWQYVRRHILHISKAKVARICGVSRGTVDRWESMRSWSMPDLVHIGLLHEEVGGELIGHVYRLMGIRSVLDRCKPRE